MDGVLRRARACIPPQLEDPAARVGVTLRRARAQASPCAGSRVRSRPPHTRCFRVALLQTPSVVRLISASALGALVPEIVCTSSVFFSPSYRFCLQDIKIDIASHSAAEAQHTDVRVAYACNCPFRAGTTLRARRSGFTTHAQTYQSYSPSARRSARRTST